MARGRRHHDTGLRPESIGGQRLDKTEQLSAQVKRLIAEPSAEVRAATAASVADEFAAGSLSDQERTIALEIIEIMAQDVERQVREALSAHVKRCPFLPPSIARQLAEAQVTPYPLTTDEQFVRRIYLDITGTIPTP